MARRRQSTRVNGSSGDNGSWSRDDYQVGAIMRVYLENFLTYDKAEFTPGPYLNMVIGPNGTGKSSLVNAICLGLGFSSKLLGRATTIGEFVKHNQRNAIILTELRGEDNENITIQVKINRETNQTTWILNDQNVPLKRVQEVVKKLRIQVDNLCQFLPQDRVVEFARLNDIELLTETLRAAAPEDVSDTHRELLDQHKAKEELQKRIAVTEAELENKKQRQAQLQDEVDRIKEREEIHEQINKLEAAKICAEYDMLTRQFAEVKERRKRAVHNLRKLEGECQPSFEATEKKKLYVQQLKEAQDVARHEVQVAEHEVTEHSRNVESLMESLKKFDDELNEHSNAFAVAKKEIIGIKRGLSDLKSQLKSDLPSLDVKTINEEIRMKSHQNREREAEISSLRDKGDRFKETRDRIRREMEQVDARLLSLDTQEGQRMEALSRYNEDAARGYEWLKDNLEGFRMKVFGPAMLTCSVIDERYVNHVEELLQRSDLTCFTTQCTEDHKKLSDHFFQNMGISVTIRTTTTPLSRYQSPLTPEQVSAFGIDGFARDFLTGPEPIISMLCGERRLHSAVVSLRAISDSTFSQLEADPAINQLLIGEQSYRISRRKDYGNMSTTSMKPIAKAKWLVKQDAGVSTEKSNLERRKAELADDKEQCLAEAMGLKEQYQALRAELAETQQEITELEQKRGEYQKEKVRLENIPNKIEKEEARLQRHKNDMRTHRLAMNEVKLKRRLATIPLGPASIAAVRAIATHRSKLRKKSELSLLIIEAESDVAFLQERSAGVQSQLAAEKANVDTLTNEYSEVRDRGKAAQSRVQRVKAVFQDTTTDLEPLYKDREMEDVVADLEAEKTKLQMLSAGNPATLQMYEALTNDIERLRAQVENGSNRMAEFKENIDRKQRVWEPQVEELVHKISLAFGYNFEQINCAGEVRLHKAERFDGWALHIMVCFRVAEEGAELVQLTGNRQSGGERSVSTIFFLMALQADAQSPFRVVDEINQGMDPRNERMVHNRMVQIACQEHSCQYFLITPKLLTNLTYDRKMTVLCIVSGPQVPSDVMKLDFGALVAKRRGIIAAGGA